MQVFIPLYCSNIHTMANITFSYRSKKDIAPIEARLSFTLSGIRFNQYARLNFEVPKTFWQEYQSGKNFRDVTKANQKTELDTHLKAVEGFVLKRFVPDADIATDWLKTTIFEYYHPRSVAVIPEGLLAYWDYYLNLREAEIKPQARTWLKWNEIKNKLARFQTATGKDFKVKDVNDDFKKLWVDWGFSESYAPETIKKNLSYIKTVCLHAQTKGIEVSRELAKLSAKIDEKETPKVYLSFEELFKIAALEGLTESLDNARDWLLISCYTGQRVSDFMRFNRSMIREAKGKQFLDLKQVKTDKDVTVPLLPEVLAILEKRKGEFPRPISDQRYNKYIKEVCQLAGINQKMKGKLATLVTNNGKQVKRSIPGTYEKWQLIGSHCGRRSFATNYYGRIATSYIMNITGHSTEAMLLKYIGKTSKDTALEAYDLMLNIKK